ncbi:MAG: bifunctional folylpolyglutamate synthase/dihydrofolate synthase [Coriobacteriia bacterium]|nr:bifunctional folylpolyglutamate synthase/dihydrofolate synthase [Coriobacteriia bacterium]
MSESSAPLTDALARLKSTKRWDINPSLEGTRELCCLLDDPQDSFTAIQVAGTNGKTSTTRIIAALLRAKGLKVGMYTSPELIRCNERIELDGAPISDADLARALDEVFACADANGLQLTEFELTTVAAFVAFRNARVDVGVLEVGLGGRWDATSVVSPQVAVITGIGLDHQAILGDTLEEIAAEKAAIIKPSSRTVMGPLTAVSPAVEDLIIEQARLCRADPAMVRGLDVAIPAGISENRVTRYTAGYQNLQTKRLVFSVKTPDRCYQELSYCGPAYQVPNIATALAAVRDYKLEQNLVQQALDTITFPGRFERISAPPPVYYDGAHNPQAAYVLADTVRQLELRPVIALGVFADKDYRGIIDALAPVARDFIAIQPPTERAFAAPKLAAELKKRTGKPPLAAQATWSLKKLLDIAEVTEGEPLLVTGSLSLYALLQSYVESSGEN